MACLELMIFFNEVTSSIEVYVPYGVSTTNMVLKFQIDFFFFQDKN
jgi:hypothetical protein